MFLELITISWLGEMCIRNKKSKLGFYDLGKMKEKIMRLKIELIGIFLCCFFSFNKAILHLLIA